MTEKTQWTRAELVALIDWRSTHREALADGEHAFPPFARDQGGGASGKVSCRRCGFVWHASAGPGPSQPCRPALADGAESSKGIIPGLSEAVRLIGRTAFPNDPKWDSETHPAARIIESANRLRRRCESAEATVAAALAVIDRQITSWTDQKDHAAPPVLANLRTVRRALTEPLPPSPSGEKARTADSPLHCRKHGGIAFVSDCVHEAHTSKGPHVQREGQAPEETAAAKGDRPVEPVPVGVRESAGGGADDRTGGVDATGGSVPTNLHDGGEELRVGVQRGALDAADEAGAREMYERAKDLPGAYAGINHRDCLWEELPEKTQILLTYAFSFAHSRGVAKGRAEGAERASEALSKARLVRKWAEGLAAASPKTVLSAVVLREVAQRVRSLEAMLAEEGG